MYDVFKENSKTIYMYPGLETITDPFDKTAETTLLNPLPIKAIVADLTFTKIQWAMPGIETDKALEIIILKKHENLLKQTYQIKVDNELYNGWQINGRLQYRPEGDYIKAYIYIKKV